ncbi:uncharacterized protein LOC122854480 [Aphidius gifuensis]|uniref:uncharacterized protein LOC122854480 n=1 Tax=Aphidius gifuensis TaxID=684658 RepID=UPI001CDCB118|nr:uncharacterized protein LOC122854480 [Aphidius gifuensis]
MNKSGYILFGLIVLVVIIQVANTQRLRECGERCKNSCQCRSTYCRGGRCIQYGQVDDERDENGNSQVTPCAYTTCPPGSICYIKEVQCVRAPCPGIVSCVNDNTTCSYK